MPKQYFNSKAGIWDDAIAEKDTHKLQVLADKLRIMPGSAMLDVGTGTGIFVPFLLQKIGPKGRLVCLDFAEDMLERARQKNFQGNIEFIAADMHASGLADGSFDTVVCYSSFPHFSYKPTALREIRRLLKVGGCLYICHSSSREVINNIHSAIPEVCHDLIPDDITLNLMLRDAGFSNINIDAGSDSFLACAVKP